MKTANQLVEADVLKTIRDDGGTFYKSKRFKISLRMIVFWSCVLGLMFVGGFIVGMLPWKDSKPFFYGILGTVSAFTAAWFFLKQEKSNLKQIGLVFEARSGGRFIYGFVIGTLIFAMMIAVLMLFTNLQIETNSLVWTPTVIIAYLAYIPLGLMEELTFRSYSLVRLQYALGIHAMQFITAVAFAVYHIVGGQDVVSSFMGPGIWAYVFGYAAMRSGGIAVPLGIHVALNVCQELLGMKGNKTNAWSFDYPIPPTAEAISTTTMIGIILHFCILVIAIILTERYRRSRQRSIVAVRA